MYATSMKRLLRVVRRLRHGLVSAFLLAALMLLNALSGCNSASDPVPLYGPPPDTNEEDGLGIDVVSPADLEDDDQPRVVYGPPPVDIIEDQVPEDVQDVHQPPPPYGPPPIDVLQDTVPWDAQDVPQPPPPYGPQPLDTIDDTP